MSLLDAGFSSTVVIQHRKPIDLGRNNSAQNREVVTGIIDALASSQGDVDALTAVLNSTTVGSKSGATLVFATSSGSVGGVINGVTVTGSGAGTDTADAAAAAAAINASVDALVRGFVRAASSYATLTLSTMLVDGKVYIRLGVDKRANTYVFTATAAATSKLGEFSISGNDTADALALCDAINAFPVLNQTIRAESVAGVAYLYAMDDVITDKAVTVAGSGITLTAAFATGPRCHVECPVPGAIGNAVTFTATGTNVSVANTNTRLVGGTGGLVGTTKRANALGV